MLKEMHKTGFFAFAALAALVVRPCAAESAGTNGKPDRVVVMISVDGLAADYLDDPKVEMPTLRRLAAEGARAASMKAVTPTVTWPNHTTLVTGDYPAKHGVVGNNYLDRATGKKVTLISDPTYDKVEIVKVPTIYDLAKSNGMKTAAIRWPASRNAPTLDWTMPDVRTKDLLEKYTTPELVTECRKDGMDVFQDLGGSEQEAGDLAAADEQYTRMFNLIMREHRPELALLHIANVDHTEHSHGPRTPAAYAAVKDADMHIREVWDELQKEFPGKATLIIVSDHGFSAINRAIFPNVILRKAGLLGGTGKKNATDGDMQMVVQGGSALLYVRNGADQAKTVAKVKKAFAGVEGIEKVVGPDEFKKYGVADPKADPHAPDMILFAKEGYTFGDTAAGELPFRDKPERKGSHGHDPDIPDLHATFVAWGAGIKPGTKVGEISNLDVAPTIAALLGIPMPGVDGKPLRQILAQ